MSGCCCDTGRDPATAGYPTGRMKDAPHELEHSPLRSDMLSTIIPTATYGGGAIANASSMLFLWRSTATEKASGGTLCFYLDDSRLELLWRDPEHYAEQFTRAGISALVEPDFSLWSDMPLVEQRWNVHRMRTLGCYWQSAGLHVIPNLAWSGARSFPFCFAGIPHHAPVVATECRTAGSTDTDRRAFLRGLTEGVKQLQPEHIVIYGGNAHGYWLKPHLPRGPAYTLLPSWNEERGKVRAAQARSERNKYQLELFGGKLWADEAQAAQ